MACARPPRCPMKYDMVIGIIGKTQGVKMAASPKPKARARNAGKAAVSRCGVGCRAGCG